MDYYLENDIKSFKAKYLLSILIGIWSVIMFLVVIVIIRYYESIIQSIKIFIYWVVIVSFYLFVFHSIILATVLFVNRQFKKESVSRSYVANYLVGDTKSKENFRPYSVIEHETAYDKKLINKLYKSSLKQSDTLLLTLNEGLFGILYSSEPMNDK